MSHHPAKVSLLVGLFLPAAFGETAPWQAGVVISVESSQTFTEVAVAVSDTLYVCRPFDRSVLGSLNAGLAHSKYKYVGVNARDVRAGANAQLAVFSNGTATLRSEKGQQYGCEIVTQSYYPSQTRSEAQQAPLRAEPSPLPPETATVNLKAEFPWKQVDDPNQRWKFTIRDQFVFGELAFAPDRQRLGDFFSIDAKKRDDRFVGTARLRATVPSEAGSNKICEWTFTVELISVTQDRIEGKLGDEVAQGGCGMLGNGATGSAIWIRE